MLRLQALRPVMARHNPSLKGKRLFHIQPADVPEFLKKASVNLGNSTRVITKPPQNSNGSIAFLIHADRARQSWPDGKSTGTFFGPSILAAPSESLSNDPSTNGPGGIGLLGLRDQQPGKVRRISLPSASDDGLAAGEAKAFGASLTEEGADQVGEIVSALWELFDKHEGLWFSFHVQASSSGIDVIDPYLEFDAFAVPRQPLLQPYFASRPRDDITAKAEDGGLFFVKLHGSGGHVGCFGYGAGNAMATMDGLNLAGGRPANFLDGGGGANRQNAKLAIETLNRDPDVKSIFVNTFGGITKTDVVAQGIIDAVKEHNITKPIITRMKGTGSEEAAVVLRDSGLPFAFHDDFRKAAAHAVKAAEDGRL